MSFPPDHACPERRAGNAGGRDQSPAGTPTDPPTHNWRPTVVHGGLALAVVAVAALAVPPDHPLALGVGVAAVFVAPMLPVALCCDYRQARRYGTCDPGIAAYLRNLARDVATALTGASALGNGRRAFDGC